MVVNRYQELNKITLKLGFMKIDIWPLNPRVMDERT